MFQELIESLARGSRAKTHQRCVFEFKGVEYILLDMSGTYTTAILRSEYVKGGPCSPVFIPHEFVADYFEDAFDAEGEVQIPNIGNTADFEADEVLHEVMPRIAREDGRVVTLAAFPCELGYPKLGEKARTYLGIDKFIAGGRRQIAKLDADFKERHRARGRGFGAPRGGG